MEQEMRESAGASAPSPLEQHIARIVQSASRVATEVRRDIGGDVRAFVTQLQESAPQLLDASATAVGQPVIAASGRLEAARPGKRVLAAIVDGALLGVVNLALAGLLAWSYLRHLEQHAPEALVSHLLLRGVLGAPVELILSLLFGTLVNVVVLGYLGLTEALAGASLGKRAVGLRVVAVRTGARPAVPDGLLRVAIGWGWVGFLVVPVTTLLGLGWLVVLVVSLVLSDGTQTLADRVTKSFVAQRIQGGASHAESGIKNYTLIAHARGHRQCRPDDRI